MTLSNVDLIYSFDRKNNIKINLSTGDCYIVHLFKPKLLKFYTLKHMNFFMLAIFTNPTYCNIVN